MATQVLCGWTGAVNEKTACIWTGAVIQKPPVSAEKVKSKEGME